MTQTIRDQRGNLAAPQTALGLAATLTVVQDIEAGTLQLRG